ncbi:bacterial peptide chain release factor 3 (bRF-3) [Sporobacter termitidis DSM 10068]|uniref:Peptide chain release factor 3 n=1 Tax=Sporobacter termitidis DSM 10068 TaxID=1123282 RepID=A0A1M5VPT1_9FIRM|nr:peptide chain release factor 3 [Sporobacter termitidis]SHH77237.1 bacterial peptide chain release factor 3 (bRF-3) [Sporobacter termitidis DSM 10068]
MTTNELKTEVSRRKTFAIISHPDAGKTTMTEKLLLYGGAIRLAGTVKGRKARQYAVSDWMEIEKQRGISVTSSVLNFDYEGYRINILDTPGHQDFSEDTYRTLVAADSAVMLIDGAKGVEEQTKKLFHVCRMRGIPIFTFVNKCDRACKNPLELMEEIEETLGIRSYPMNWPIGTDGDFKGVYDRQQMKIELFEGGNHGQNIAASDTGNVDDVRFEALLGERLYNKLREDVALLDIAGDAFDMEKVRAGELTPMFFGSAMTNFGIRQFLEAFLSMAPSPGGRTHSEGGITPEDENFSGFVFKIQANMDAAHRDRIAFIRICSGKYEKGMEVSHARTKRKVRLAQSQQFMAQERTSVEEAYAGDIIGVFDPGTFKIGDTLVAGQKLFRYEGIPMFPAEHFAEVLAKDSSKRKQFLKGIQQISEEGAIQVFKDPNIGIELYTIGVAGELQFEVLEYRLKNEYNVDIQIRRLPYSAARWVVSDQKFTKDNIGYYEAAVVEDQYERTVVLAKNQWTLGYIQEKNKDVTFLDIAPPIEE